jgi:hypothetical protein
LSGRAANGHERVERRRRSPAAVGATHAGKAAGLGKNRICKGETMELFKSVSSSVASMWNRKTAPGSYFASVESVQRQWNLDSEEAERAYKVWARVTRLWAEEKLAQKGDKIDELLNDVDQSLDERTVLPQLSRMMEGTSNLKATSRVVTDEDYDRLKMLQPSLFSFRAIQRGNEAKFLTVFDTMANNCANVKQVTELAGKFNDTFIPDERALVLRGLACPRGDPSPAPCCASALSNGGVKLTVGYLV